MILNWEQETYTDPSNYGSVRDAPPLFIVLHGTGLSPDATSDNEIAYLLRPQIKVSYHMYLRKDGRVRQLAPLEHVAYHAGESSWTEGERTWERLNAYSIGVGLETHNLGEPYPLEQLQAAVGLTSLLMWQYEIPKTRVLTHRMISYPRKVDPVAFPFEDFISRLAT